MTLRAANPATNLRDRSNPLERWLAIRIPLNAEVAFYAAILALAIGLRFFDLGSRALHHDESIHAQWSWDLLRGNYHHSPVFHGPFYYHIQAAVFFLVGENDYTSRVSAAIFGSGIVALPLLLRRWLGPVGTMAAVALLACSPTVVNYSRFFREDIYMAFFVLLMVVALWRYVDDGKERWLFVFAAAFVGGVTTKEGMFLTIAVFLIALDVYVAGELAAKSYPNAEDRWNRWLITAAITPVAAPLVAFWPMLGSIRERWGWEKLPRSGDLFILLGTLSLPLLTPILRIPLEKAGIVDNHFIQIAGGQRQGQWVSRLDWENHLQNGATNSDRLALGGLFLLTTSAAAFVGLQWKPKLWAICFGVGALVYLTLMTSFWTNADGLISGPWGSLDYWRGQQGEYRGDQPWFYYYMVMPMYEFLPLAICLGGLWWSTIRGNAFSRFLVFWLVGQWLVLSYGSEKMPWLNTHLAVPACLLAAWTINRAWRAWTPRPPVSQALLGLVSMAGLGAAALALIVYLPGSDPLAQGFRVVIALAAAGAAVFVMRPFGRKALAMAAAMIVVGGLSIFSLRTMTDASFQRADVPKDLLIYTQSSPDIPDIMREIEKLAEVTGKGKSLPILIDGHDSFAWPWAWYLRDWKCVGYPDLESTPVGTSNCDGVTQPYAVVLVNKFNISKVTDELAGAGSYYGAGRDYPHRWWFNENYKDGLAVEGRQACTGSSGDCGPFRLATWETIGEGIFKRGWLTTWFDFWRDHDPDKLGNATGARECNSCGSTDGVAFFPANFDPKTGKAIERVIPVIAPTVDTSGRPQFGGQGFLPGQLSGPTDIETDGQGNLYVIDHTTQKLSKFDARGNFLAAVDIRLTPGSSTEGVEPWGLAIGPDGTIVVAHTFGWRIRVFDKDLKSINTFGQAFDSGSGKPPGPYDLFGPRDAAFAPDGTLWITDTGNNRIIQYTAQGEFLQTVGTKGSGQRQFLEPIGIQIAADGTIYVGDTWNSRVQVLDSRGAYKSEFKVDGWGGHDTTDKPYIRLLKDGGLAVSLPLQNQVRVYNADGTVRGTITDAVTPLSRPYGMAESADGKLWIVEGGASRVRLFDLP